MTIKTGTRNEGNETMATTLTEAVLTAKINGEVQAFVYNGTEDDFEAELTSTYLKRDRDAVRKLVSPRFSN